MAADSIKCSRVHDRSASPRAHRPTRPLWLCRVCAAPWPCSTARLALLREYTADRVSLSVYMAGVMHEAAGDLWRLNPSEPELANLFGRFLAWTRRPA